MDTVKISEQLKNLNIKPDEVSFRHVNRTGKSFWNFEIKAKPARKREIKRLLKSIEFNTI